MSISVQPSRPTHAIAVLLAAVLWGTTGTVAHFAPAGSNPLAIGLATFGIGGVVLAAVSARQVRAVLRQRGHLAWVLIGAIGVVLYPACYYPAMALAGVAVGNVVALGSGPVFAALLEWIVDRRRPDARWAVATAVAGTGIVLLATGEDAAGGAAASADPAQAPIGIALALVAGFGYALYAFAGARLIGRGAPSTGAMGALFLVGGVACIAWLALIGIGPLGSPAGVATIAYLGLVPMALAYLLFGYGLRVLRSSTATTIALLEPVVATLLAVAVVGERPSPIGWAGLAAIALGIALLTVRRPLTVRGRRVALLDGAAAASAAPDSAETADDDAGDTEQGHDRARPEDQAPQR